MPFTHWCENMTDVTFEYYPQAVRLELRQVVMSSPSLCKSHFLHKLLKKIFHTVVIFLMGCTFRIRLTF